MLNGTRVISIEVVIIHVYRPPAFHPFTAYRKPLDNNAYQSTEYISDEHDKVLKAFTCPYGV